MSIFRVGKLYFHFPFSISYSQKIYGIAVATNRKMCYNSVILRKKRKRVNPMQKKNALRRLLALALLCAMLAALFVG